MNKSLPVLMYHSITTRRDSIGVHPARFEAHLKMLRDTGWRGAGLDEIRAYLEEGLRPPENICCITFDDGYLDNYVYAWPLLEQYGHKAVIFAVTDEIETGDIRPCLSDVWKNRAKQEDLPNVDDPDVTDEHGFLRKEVPFFNWAEARRMEDSGVMRIEAHTNRHASVFSSTEFSRFHQPQGRKRTFEGVLFDRFYGLPEFENGPAFSSTAFLPDPDLCKKLKAAVPQTIPEAIEFFNSPESVETIYSILSEHGEENWGRFETPDEKWDRMYSELAKCVETLTRELGRTPEALAWPWGAWDEQAEHAAEEFGLSMRFTTQPGANRPGDGIGRIHRFKVKDRSAGWLKSRMMIYSRPWLSALYLKVRR